MLFALRNCLKPQTAERSTLLPILQQQNSLACKVSLPFSTSPLYRSSIFSARFPDKVLPAVTCLYRAMRVYPYPVDLMVALEQSFPPLVFKATMEMVKLDLNPNPSPPAMPKFSAAAASDLAFTTSSRKPTRRSRKNSGTSTSSGKSSLVATSTSYEWALYHRSDSSATPPLVPQGPIVA